ncbi:MAG: SUF system NifU family Fe-S cluster assembly protein [Lachnospiraceae bacterium]|nr:SUF system NifU family Fe-S cluster assembly protein [Lachnospiraceae bacterium]
MQSNGIYGSSILNEHNLRPSHKKPIKDPTIVLEGVNPTCGDDIFLQLKVKDGIIEDGSFSGSGCAISQASCDMMLDLVIGENVQTAVEYINKFFKMIHGEATEEEIDELDEAGILKDISHMPARVKCALLGWRTLKDIIENGTDSAAAHAEHPECSGM